MISGNRKLAPLGIGLSLGQWVLAGCGGAVSAGGAITPGGGEGDDGFPFPGGIGVSPALGGTQGVAIDPNNNIYISSTQQLVAYDRNWHVLWTNDKLFAGLPSAVSHLGDVDYGNGYIYGPVEAWRACTSYLPAVLAVYSAETGQLVTWSDITADRHEASSVAVIPGSNQLVVSSYCSNESGFTTLWSYDLNALAANAPGSTITSIGTITLSTAIAQIQGISWNATASQFAIAADNNGQAGSLWLATATGSVTGPVYIVPASVGTELEGVDYNSGDLYYLENGYVYGVGPVPATPVFGLAPGTYCGTQAVTITDATSGATIYYTTDGTVASTSAAVYTGPLTVSASATVRAIAMGSGLVSSAEAAATYTINTSGCSAGAGPR